MLAFQVSKAVSNPVLPIVPNLKGLVLNLIDNDLNRYGRLAACNISIMPTIVTKLAAFSVFRCCELTFYCRSVQLGKIWDVPT